MGLQHKPIFIVDVYYTIVPPSLSTTVDSGCVSMDTLHRIRHVTEHYLSLQGLRILPFGVLLLLWGLNDLFQFWPAFMTWHPFSTGISILVAWACSLFIGRYYYEPRFGRVRPRKRGRTGALFLAGWLLAAPLAWIAMRDYALPFDLFGIVAVLALGGYWWHRYDYRWHDVIILAALLVLCILPVFGPTPLHGQPDAPAALRPEVYMLSAGFVMIAVGSSAHVHLTKLLPVGIEEETV